MFDYHSLFRKKEAGSCLEHGGYHICECGMSHLCGTSNAEHELTHDGYAMKPILSGLGYNIEKMYPTARERAEAKQFNPWEAPAPECPVCFQKEIKP